MECSVLDTLNGNFDLKKGSYKMKILFLDVDGPLIPLRLHRQVGGIFKYDTLGGYYVWDKEFIEDLNCACPVYDIKIVFNSAHNTSGPDIMKSTAAANGLNIDLLHDDVCTKYPWIDNRVDAINDWLHRNVPVGVICKWLVVDDFELPVKHMINVSLDEGMTPKKIMELFSRFLIMGRAPNVHQTNVFIKE
jgi:hypothetical protein